MSQERYSVLIDADSETYEFVSIGNRGATRKRVTFRLVQSPNIYNLGFGDIDLMTDEIDDLSVTNNGDSQKVLITVANTVLDFTYKCPDAFVFANQEAEHRLIVSNYLEMTYSAELDKYKNRGLSEHDKRAKAILERAGLPPQILEDKASKKSALQKAETILCHSPEDERNR